MSAKKSNLARTPPTTSPLHAFPGSGKPQANLLRERTPMSVPLRTPVTQHALAQLQAQILDGSLPPGHRLDSQRELAERMLVSRASLREAISSLEALGLVRVEPGRGVFVTAESERFPQQRDQNNSLVGHSQQEMYEARLLMEGWAAALAAVSITDAQLEHLGQVVDAMQQALSTQDNTALDQLDYAFHNGIAEACENRLLRKLLSPVFSEHDMSNARITDAAFISTRVKEHREIFAALATRDPVKAQQAMRTHVRRSAKRANVSLSADIERIP